MEPSFTFSRFDEMCAKEPGNTALYYLGERYSYGRLAMLIDRFAAGLVKIGVKPQDRIMLYIPNCPQWIIANFAINKIGAITVPVSPIYTAYEIEYMIEDANIKTVICLDTNFVYVREVLKKTGLERVIVTDLVELMPVWKRVIGHLFDKIPTGKIERGKEVYSFWKLIKENWPKPPKVEIDPYADLSYVMYTGGTTGFPKGVPGNHMGEVSYIKDIMDDVIGDRMTESKETVLMVNPLFHIMAKGFMIAFGFNFGNTVILMPQPDVDATLKAIERYKVGWMLGVPALYRMMLENDRLDQYDLSSLKYCYCGGDVLPAEVFKTWKSRYSIPIYQVYGSTEAGHVAYSLLDREPKPTVVGTPLQVAQVHACRRGIARSRRLGRGRGVARHIRTYDKELLEQAGRDDPLLRADERRHVLQDGRFHADERGRRARVHGADRRHDKIQGIPHIGLRDRGGPAGPSYRDRRVLRRHPRPEGGGEDQGHSRAQGRRKRRREQRADEVVQGPARVLQDPPLHRIPRYAPEIEGGQAPEERDQGRGKKEARQREAKSHVDELV